LALIRPRAADNIEDGLCWFKHLPMANDGNTVMAVYVGPALSRPSSPRLCCSLLRLQVRYTRAPPVPEHHASLGRSISRQMSSYGAPLLMDEV
jgi:hypothetical protein